VSITHTSRQAVLERLTADRGTFAPAHAMIADWDPRAVELFHENYMHVMTGEGPLSPKFRELLLVAVDAATYYHDGTRVHMRDALAKGATEEEVFQAVKVAALAGGMHVLLDGAEQLRVVLEQQGAKP
jgi:AhpD family alkylhydroperoxidase